MKTTQKIHKKIAPFQYDSDRFLEELISFSGFYELDQWIELNIDGEEHLSLDLFPITIDDVLNFIEEFEMYEDKNEYDSAKFNRLKKFILEMDNETEYYYEILN